VADLWTQLARDLIHRLDTDIPTKLAGSLAINPQSLRLDLRRRQLDFMDPQSGQEPRAESLQRTTDRLIKDCARAATIGGAVSGIAGVAGVPAEVALRMTQLLRLTQRLMVVYGHDLTTDKSKLLAQRAIAAAYEISLPTQAGLQVRVCDLPTLLRDSTPTAHQGATWLAQAAVRQTTRAVLRPIGRTVPGLASAPAAWRARKTIKGQAARILKVIQRASAGPGWRTQDSTDAVELG
jgi:hypothetical protein